MSLAPDETALQNDLNSDSPDAAYRAMSFIARRGGPQIAGPADDVANLMAHRADMRAWLQSRPELTTLENDYLEYREHWSPLFQD